MECGSLCSSRNMTELLYFTLYRALKISRSLRGRRKDIWIRRHFLVTHQHSAFSTEGLKLITECDSVSLNADMSTQIRGSPVAAGSRWDVQVDSSSLWCPGPPQEAPPPQSHPGARPGWWSAALAHGSPGRGAVWLRIASTNIAQVLTQSFKSAVVLKCRTLFVTSQAGNTLIPKTQSVKLSKQSIRTKGE